jgi:hypothetical protein
MDAGHILVAVLTTAAVGWLVWVEFNCRRNHTKQTTGVTAEDTDCGAACRKEVGNGDHESPGRGRRKRRGLAARQET